MTVARPKGDKGLCDVLFSRIIRSRGACERCGKPATDTAHIVKRRYSATRCDERNAWALCNTCHRVTEEWAHEFMLLVDNTIGRELYDELRRTANGGVLVSSANWWAMEVDRLKARCVELELDTRRRIPA